MSRSILTPKARLFAKKHWNRFSRGQCLMAGEFGEWFTNAHFLVAPSCVSGLDVERHAFGDVADYHRALIRAASFSDDATGSGPDGDAFWLSRIDVGWRPGVLSPFACMGNPVLSFYNGSTSRGNTDEFGDPRLWQGIALGSEYVDLLRWNVKTRQPGRAEMPQLLWVSDGKDCPMIADDHGRMLMPLRRSGFEHELARMWLADGLFYRERQVVADAVTDRRRCPEWIVEIENRILAAAAA